MSKEKALLKRVRDTLHELKETHYDLYWDIQTALDQYEQEHVGIVRIIGGYPDNSERVVDWVRPYKYLKDGDKLYLAPKREPLRDEEIDKGYQESNGNYYDLAFRDGVRFAEKHHGIGVEL